MAIKPILFHTQMVLAILDGQKTVTRRVVKPQPEGRPVLMEPDSCWPGFFAIQETEKVIRPPYHPGDILWVRETWQAVYETEWSEEKPYIGNNIRDLISNFDNIQKVEAGISSECSSTGMEPRMKYFVFKASNIQYTDDENRLIWRPSIHMPREAARLFLRVTGVRVERLQEIDDDGVVAEGLEIGCYFDEIWDCTIKPKDRAAYGWVANPWVWVVEFERCDRPSDWE